MAMPVHEFTLYFEGPADLPFEALDRLFQAGCDDATFGSRGGVTHATFHREAPSRNAAIESAIRDVERAGVGLSVLRVEVASAV